MTITVFSVIMSIVCSSIILFIAGFLVSHVKRVRWGLILLILLLGFARLLLPVEIRVAKELFDWRIYPHLQLLAHRRLLFGLSVAKLLLLVWGIGTLIQLLLFRRELKEIRAIGERAVPVMEGDGIHAICADAAASLGYQGTVRLAVTKELYTAVSAGVLKPFILLPREMRDFETMELRGVIRHELTHYLHGDVGKQRLLILVQCLFWWNPVVYYLKHCMERLMELACDEHACAGMGETERKAYLRAITKVLRLGGRRTPRMGLGYRKEGKETFLHRRFREVLSPMEKHSDAVTLLLAALCLTLFCLSYSVILQPASMPEEYVQSEVSNTRIMSGEEAEGDFLLRQPDGTYLYVSGMLGVRTLSEEEAHQAPYAGLPVYDKRKGE